MLDIEAGGAKKLDNYQNFAKAFDVNHGVAALGYCVIDAKAIGLPMLDRMYKEYNKGTAPEALEKLAGQIRQTSPRRSLATAASPSG